MQKYVQQADSTDDMTDHDEQEQPSPSNVLQELPVWSSSVQPLLSTGASKPDPGEDAVKLVCTLPYSSLSNNVRCKWL